MTKFASLLGRKPALVTETPQGPAAASRRPPPAPDKNVLELDQELFFPIASQLGEENEVVRNLLIDAEHKITELDSIKQLARPAGRSGQQDAARLRRGEEREAQPAERAQQHADRLQQAARGPDHRREEGRDARHRMHPPARGAHRRAAELDRARNHQGRAVRRADRAPRPDHRTAAPGAAASDRPADSPATKASAPPSGPPLADSRMAQLEADTAAASQKFHAGGPGARRRAEPARQGAQRRRADCRAACSTPTSRSPRRRPA